MAMPPGTVYAEWQPCMIGHICIKDDTTADSNGRHIDWLTTTFGQEFTDPTFEQTCDRLEAGEDVTLDPDCYGREGSFAFDQLYVVWSKADLTVMVKQLQTALDWHK